MTVLLINLLSWFFIIVILYFLVEKPKKAEFQLFRNLYSFGETPIIFLNIRLKYCTLT